MEVGFWLGKGKSISTWTTEFGGGWRFIKSKRVKYIKNSGGRESDNVKKLGREEELIGGGLSLSHYLVVSTP